MTSQLNADIAETARRISVERLAHLAKEIDRNHVFPRESIRLLCEAGFNEVGIPEGKGGIGLGRSVFSSVVKEIAKVCASTALVYVSHSVATRAVEMGGGEEIQKKWLTQMLKGNALGAFAVHEQDCGSNAGAITTRAVKDGDWYVVNGEKFFITSAGEANVYIVLVRTAPEKGAQGMSTLFIEKDTPGLAFGKPEDKMGLKGTSSREMFFSDCRVPVKNLIGGEGQGTQIIGKALVGWGFFGAAAISAGIARSATDLAIKHTKERTIGGQPIAVHQAVQSMITDMTLKTEAMDAFLDRCADQADTIPDKVAISAFKSKLFTSEAAIEVANLAIQAMGGHGYCRDYVVERLFRDARGLTLHFKTSEWLRQDIAKILTGL